RWPRLVEVDRGDTPARKLFEHHARSVVSAFGERDDRAGLEEREHDRRARGRAGREEERLSTVERAESSLGFRDRWAREARVAERSRLAVFVCPCRRPVDRRGHAATRAPVAAAPRAPAARPPLAC